MKIVHLIRKAVFRSRMDGFKDMLREMVYLKRTMIVIEKEIGSSRPVRDNELNFVVVDGRLLKENREKCEWPLIRHYCSRGASCVMAYLGGRLAGYQFYTQDNHFPDLLKIGISLTRQEAYLFDLFVFPEYRGTEITKKIVDWTFQHLRRQGITKIYGFYFADNIRSLWWHKAVLKCKEVMRIKASRLLFLEWTDREKSSPPAGLQAR